tara:strand:+ start:10747 stop:12378 length:1632 start_codon:yes stop_codon:yes gene_type:complete
MTSNKQQQEIIPRDNFYFVTNKRNLLTILAAGCLVPASASYRYVDDSRMLADGRILLWAADVPRELVTSDSVIVEIDPEFIEFSTKYTRRKSPKYGRYLLPSVPVPLALMRRFLFQDTIAKDDFLLRLFDDVPIDPERMGTFSVADLSAETVGSIKVPKESFVDIGGLDKRCGAVLAALHLAHPSVEVLNVISDLYGNNSLGIEKVGAPGKIAGHEAGSDGKLADKWMFDTVLSILSQTSPDHGFDQKAFLRQLVTASETATENISNSVHKWAAYVARIIDGEVDGQPLEDSGSVIQRGILFFLLRPSISRLAASRDALLQPGHKVYAVGAFLSGFYTGATRLPGEYKLSFAKYSLVMSVLLQDWLTVPSVTKKMKLEVRRSEPGRYEALVSIAETVISELPISLTPVHSKIIQIARSVGFDLAYDFSADELSCEYVFEDGKKQTVYITCIKPKNNDEHVIRFTSPCWSLAKKVRFLKEDAVDLLKRNDAGDMLHCRFAISEQRNSVVVHADHIVDEMNEKVFRRHVNAVAHAAHNYRCEKEG